MEHLLFNSSKSAFYGLPHFSKCHIYFSTRVKSLESFLMPFSNIQLSVLLQTFWTLPFKHVHNLTTFHQHCGSSQHRLLTGLSASALAPSLTLFLILQTE